MKLNAIGEFGLIDLIKQEAIVDPEGVAVGIGDDAAAYFPAQGRLQLLTTDMLVENIHFTKSILTPRQLGYKALAVNISDIAAMGGTPRHSVISLGIPKDCELEYILELYQGMRAICKEYLVNIIGGDTVRSPNGLIINVCLTGDAEEGKLIRRLGAQPGDLILVTGCLGDSAAGLEWLLKGGEASHYPGLVNSHTSPIPRLKAGQAAALAGATSMNDISDGLASEANEIASAGKIGMLIDAQKIPLSLELISYADRMGTNPLDYALYGGEDYQLLITMPPQAAEKLKEQVQDLTVIGEVCTGSEVILENNGRYILEPKGYNHFR